MMRGDGVLTHPSCIHSFLRTTVKGIGRLAAVIPYYICEIWTHLGVSIFRFSVFQQVIRNVGGRQGGPFERVEWRGPAII